MFMKCRGAVAEHPVELMEQTTATTVKQTGRNYTSNRRRVEREGAENYWRRVDSLQ